MVYPNKPIKDYTVIREGGYVDQFRAGYGGLCFGLFRVRHWMEAHAVRCGLAFLSALGTLASLAELMYSRVMLQTSQA